MTRSGIFILSSFSYPVILMVKPFAGGEWQGNQILFICLVLCLPPNWTHFFKSTKKMADLCHFGWKNLNLIDSNLKRLKCCACFFLFFYLGWSNHDTHLSQLHKWIYLFACFFICFQPWHYNCHLILIWLLKFQNFKLLGNIGKAA